MLAEFRRISEEPSGASKKARTFRIALEGGIRYAESRIEWLDWAIEQVSSQEWMIARTDSASGGADSLGPAVRRSGAAVIHVQPGLECEPERAVHLVRRSQ